jgi:hypothetical protein
MGLNRDLEPARMTALSTPTTTRPQVGNRTELGRYALPDGTVRLLIGQRIDGSVRLVDVPLASSGRRYVIERELEQDGYAALKALAVDYLQVAARLGEIPMAQRAQSVREGMGLR